MTALQPARRRASADRRPEVVRAAIDAFAAGGWGGTTYADVAARASISPAYVAKLFPRKELLFTAGLAECFRQILLVISAEAGPGTPAEVLDRMAGAYARLVSDRPILMMQVHAQSAASSGEIRTALVDGLARLTETAAALSGADGPAVQRFMAYGQLCHLVVTAGVDGSSADWARTLAHGIRHPG